MVNVFNIKIFFAILAVAGVIGAFSAYFRDIFLKKTKPHAYTWLIWTITQGTALAGLWYGKGGWGALALASGTFLVFAVFLLSLKYGTRNITRGDTAILIAALLAIVAWWQLHQPLLAVAMASIIDFLGYLPSFRKTLEEPWTETPISWAVFSAANIFSIMALNQYNLLTLTYLITITVANTILLVICLTRRPMVPRPNL